MMLLDVYAHHSEVILLC